MVDVALGSLGWVMRDLTQSGFLTILGKKGQKLVKKEELLKAWVLGFELS
jgi:hypothetical protein